MIDSVSRTGAVWAEVPHKFEAGTVNGAGAYALAEAIRYVQKIGFDFIEEREAKLTKTVDGWDEGDPCGAYFRITESGGSSRYRDI